MGKLNNRLATDEEIAHEKKKKNEVSKIPSTKYDMDGKFRRESKTY